MIYLHILADEIYRSYFGRLKRVNGFSSDVAVWNTLGFPEQAGRFPPRKTHMRLLAKAANKTVPDFMLHHTLCPDEFGMTDWAPLLDRKLRNPKQAPDLGYEFDSRKAFFCSNCVSEDLSERGMSYWRRDHQLHGVWECLKHSSPLRFVAVTDPFMHAPSFFRGASEEVDWQHVAAYTRNDALRKFVAFSRALLRSEHLIEWSPLKSAILNRAQARKARLGMRTKADAALMISSLIFKQFPTQWLSGGISETEFVDEHQFGIYLNSVFRSARPPSVVIAILVCAVLFDSPEEALGGVTTEAGQNPAVDHFHDEYFRFVLDAIAETAQISGASD